MNIFRAFTSISATLVFALTLATTDAEAVVIYDFEGTCTSNCAGTTTGVLTLAATHTPGTALSNADFISWDYMSSTITFSIPTDIGFLSIGGILPVISGTTVSNMFIDYADAPPLGGGGTIFRSQTTGFWENFCINIPAGCPSSQVDRGLNSHQWTLRSSVPEPSILMLMSTGILIMGFMTARRRTIQ